MSLKISFFNKGLFFSNLKRFAWAGILETIILFLCFPFNLMMMDTEMTWLERYSDILAWSEEYTAMSNMTICVYAVVLGVLLFHYLHQPKMTTALHGLPVSRTELFFSTLLSGAALLIAPIAINVLMIFFVKATMEIGAWVVASSVLRWAAYAIALSLVLFAFSSFVGMFVGNPAAQLVFTYILHFLPLAVFAGIQVLCQMFLLGFSTEFDVPNWIVELPMMTIMHDFTKPCGYYILLFGILAVVFFALALLAYKKRPLENAGDVVVFEWVKPVFKYGVSICFAVAGFLYIAAISGMDTRNNLVMTTLVGALWAAVGFCIAQMLIAKTWRIFGAYKELFCTCLAVALLFVIFQSDVTGYERRMVEPEEVASVSLSGFYEFPENVITLDEPENIALLVRLHKNVIESDGVLEEGDYSVHMNMNYTLKDGTTFKRAYSVKAQPLLYELYNTEEAKREGYYMLYDGAERIESLSLYYDGERYYINDKERILAALRTDIEAKVVEPWWDRYERPSVQVFEAEVVSHVEEIPEVVYDLEIEMLPDAEEEKTYYEGYRHYYSIRLSADETPTAFAVLEEMLPELQPETEE